jgi:hypothetical protein
MNTFFEDEEEAIGQRKYNQDAAAFACGSCLNGSTQFLIFDLQID